MGLVVVSGKVPYHVVTIEEQHEELTEHEQSSYPETQLLSTCYNVNVLYLRFLYHNRSQPAGPLLTLCCERCIDLRRRVSGPSKGSCRRFDPQDVKCPRTPRRPLGERNSVMLVKLQQDSYKVVLEVRRASSWLISNTLQPCGAESTTAAEAPARPWSTILLRNLYDYVLLGWHLLLIHKSLVRTRLYEPTCCEQAMHCEQTIF
ncbi:hypothetical protein T4A_3731 [Trichinella pseudospiralis]|uniref:Uncharacterized protein n=1 Tax=Trichinella pseudospiralis TaxID=6337 RepID=A0A0V1ESR3_TRIPS|nr:hypothetical protein T4A_3731 [Trichinella pseudospiralis]